MAPFAGGLRLELIVDARCDFLRRCIKPKYNEPKGLSPSGVIASDVGGLSPTGHHFRGFQARKARRLWR